MTPRINTRINRRVQERSKKIIQERSLERPKGPERPRGPGRPRSTNDKVIKYIKNYKGGNEEIDEEMRNLIYNSLLNYNINNNNTQQNNNEIRLARLFLNNRNTFSNMYIDDFSTLNTAAQHIIN